MTVHKFDVIYLSETYLDSSIPVDDNNLENSGSIPVDDNNLENSGYNLIRSNHSSNSKRGGVCIYYKNLLPLRVYYKFRFKNRW